MASPPRPVPLEQRVSALEHKIERECGELRSAIATGLGNVSHRIDALCAELDGEVRAQLASFSNEVELPPGPDTRMVALVGTLRRERFARELLARESEDARKEREHYRSESIRVQRSADEFQAKANREQRLARRALWAAVIAFAAAFGHAVADRIAGGPHQADHQAVHP